jgi:hypothetical protein
MLDILETRRSWVTQRLANRYPPWAKLRKFAQSIGQQILEPMGRELEDYYWWSNYNLGNYLLNTSDINQLSGIYTLSLPPTFEWRTSQQVDAVVYLTPTSVRGLTSSGWVTLSQATENKLEEFWYGVPDRVLTAGESYSYSSCLSSTQVSSLSSAMVRNPSVPGKLWVTLSNNGSSIKNYKGNTVRSFVTIRGRDIHGNDVKEHVYFGFNGTIQTKLAWSEVTTVETSYIDDIAFLRIDWLSVGQTEPLDLMGLHVTKDREKFRFWSLGSASFGATLKHLVFSSDDIVLVEEGEDTKHAEAEIQLFNSAGSNISSALSMIPWPKRRWIIITDGSNLHFFVPDLRMESLEPVAEATAEAVVQADVDKEWVLQGDVVTLDYNMKRPFVRVLRTRWSVEKPDGSRVGISPTGSEIAYSSSGWVNHPEGTLFNSVGFQGDYIEYTINSYGRYVFYLESMITDVLSTEGQSKPTIHMDVRVVHSAYDTAEASISLPVSIGTASILGFDSYHRPWVINTNGTAHRLTFHYDRYLADFQNKTIIIRENYTSLEVDA